MARWVCTSVCRIDWRQRGMHPGLAARGGILLGFSLIPVRRRLRYSCCSMNLRPSSLSTAGLSSGPGVAVNLSVRQHLPCRFV